MSGRMGAVVATVADHDHRWRYAAGPVRAGDAAGGSLEATGDLFEP